MIDTRGLNKVLQAYNGDHDLGAEAPIHWSVEELALIVGELVEKIEIQEGQIEALQDEISDHRLFGKH